MSERVRRSGTKVKPHAGFAELRKLREQNQKRNIEIEEPEDLYEEVDEDEYKKVVRKRLDEDDFVIDDGGEGYMDNGMDDWGEGREVYSDEEAEDDRKLSSKERKRKREEEQERKSKQEGDIHKYFNKGPAVLTKAKTTSTIEDREFLDDLLGEFDTNMNVTNGRSAKKRKEEPPRKTRMLSPPRKTLKKPVHIDGNDAVAATADPPSSPPPIANDDDDEYGGADFVVPPMDDDIPMSDVPIPPSSPTLQVAERKPVVVKTEEPDDDDDFAVAEIKGNKNIRTEKVNISSSRPAKPTAAPSTPVKPKIEAIDSSVWNKVNEGLNVMSSPASDMKRVSKVEPQDVLEEDGTIKMFWTDYTEANGALMLFGKVKDRKSGRYVSTFLKIDGIMRNLYFLQRDHKYKNWRETDEEVTMVDLHEEVISLMEKRKVNISEIKAKAVNRHYAFELADIPRESEYLKVLYPYTYNPLPIDLDGECFSHVFGTNTALFEQFVLCRRVMGPCWLKVENADFNAVRGASWCKFEMRVKEPQHITTIGNDSIEAPPLTLMTMALRTMHNAKDNKQEIIAISCRIYEDVSINDAAVQVDKMPHQMFTIVRPMGRVFPSGFEKLKERRWSRMHLEKSESMILSNFLTKLVTYDPDVLLGHQLENVDYPILLHRMRENKSRDWSRIGRMKRTGFPQSGGKFAGTFFAERQLCSGRLMCDLANDLGKSLMTQCQSWSLTEMCKLLLDIDRQELDNEDALKSWAASGQGFFDYLEHCEADAHFIAAIAIKIQMLPLTKQLTNLAGNSWARTLSGTRAERNEFILLHEFHKNKYICPDKVYGKSKVLALEENPDEEGTRGTKKKDKYKGGLVFEPEKGLYDKHILVMDFNSLYPSIIQEYNICFTTIERANLDEEQVPEVPKSLEKDEPLAIFPRLIQNLVVRRREVKKLMKDKNATAVQKTQWDIRQQALKLTANSMYGCLGYTRSRFYARPLAMLTTHKGREILQSTKSLAESMSLRVIYGDTDSVMINTLADNYADAIKVGLEFKKAVNERYKKLEIDIDNVFERLLLHAKKKYAAMNCINIGGKLSAKLEVKGLDMRRREYSQLSKDASKDILDLVFSCDDKEAVVEKIHDYLRDLSGKIREHKFMPVKYIIYTKLGKNPEDYPNGDSMPQVQVARKKKDRGDAVKAGDVISFIITGGGDHNDRHAAERAYPAQDVIKPSSNLQPDPEWYLIKQIFPPIERLCGPIEGTDSHRLAECLGLDTRKYQFISSASAQNEREIYPLESSIPDEERFKDARKLALKCRYCGNAFEFQGLTGSTDTCTPQGIKCRNQDCGQLLPVVSVVAQVERQLREMVAKYYDAWLVCDDSSCANRTRQMSVYGKRCMGPKGLAKGCKGSMRYEYTDKMLYNQLLYYRSLFNLEKAKKADGENREKVGALAVLYIRRFGTISNAIEKYLDKCGRQWVGMDNIFAFSAA